ncbi:hypothetical protein IJ114_02795 [Candidatus Saccharibacteria bacterium]|nr:hypothetical protein [Candidatus Saccharibacteria bacterium]
MFFVFTGDDRAKISQEVKKVLGETYEVFEGENLNIQDLVNICQGMSLFSSKRKILIKDLTPARKDEGDEMKDGIDFYAELKNYVNTPHEIVIWETKVSRKKSFKEFKAMPGVKALEFKLGRPADANLIFNVVDIALRDGERAVKELRKLEDDNDPYMFTGIMVGKLCTLYNYRMGSKEKRALVALSELDMAMKTTTISPWSLIESYLLQLSSL